MSGERNQNAEPGARPNGPIDLNPYAPPQAVGSEAPDANCSFCGRRAVDAGSLVQSPRGNCYICLSCAQMISEMLIAAQPTRGQRIFELIVFGGAICLAIGLFIWDAFVSEFPQVSRWLTLPMVVALVVWLVALVRRVLAARPAERKQG
jgi:hypothetical protein